VGSLGLISLSETQEQMQKAALQSEMLGAHNAARRQLGFPPLEWSRHLEAHAAGYAVTMAQSHHFAHSTDLTTGPPQGENLWMGTRNAYSYAEMAGAWVDERQHYFGGSINQALSDGSMDDIGHYTQIIWRRTTHFGCAIASSAANDYLVCRYLPAGNVEGSSPGS
jgi:uncharacterized protein YkwD